MQLQQIQLTNLEQRIMQQFFPLQRIWEQGQWQPPPPSAPPPAAVHTETNEAWLGNRGEEAVALGKQPSQIKITQGGCKVKGFQQQGQNQTPGEDQWQRQGHGQGLGQEVAVSVVATGGFDIPLAYAAGAVAGEAYAAGAVAGRAATRGGRAGKRGGRAGTRGRAAGTLGRRAGTGRVL